MKTVMPLVLFALAGLLAGGFVSLRRQGASRPVLGLLGALVVLATAGGVAWLWPQS